MNSFKFKMKVYLILKEIPKILAWTDYTGGGIIMCENTNNKSSALYSYQDSKYYSFYYSNPHSSRDTYHHNILGFDPNRTNVIYGNSNHVTPLNYSIKIWKRISYFKIYSKRDDYILFKQIIIIINNKDNSTNYRFV